MDLENKLLEVEKEKTELQNKVIELEKKILILEERISKKQKPFQTGEGWYYYQKNWDDPKAYLFYVNNEGKVEKMIISEKYEKRWNENRAESGYNYKGYSSLSDEIVPCLFPDRFWGEYVEIAKKIDSLTKGMLEFRVLCNDL